jgi:hypothetical protein
MIFTDCWALPCRSVRLALVLCYPEASNSGLTTMLVSRIRTC